MTVTRIHPNADANGIVWGRNPASGAAWDKLADSTPTTYLSAPGTGLYTYQGIDFGSITILGTQRIRALKFWVEYRFTNQGYFEVRFIRAGEQASKVAIVQQSSVATAGGPVASVWFTSDPSGQEWTQGSLDSVSMRLYDKATSGSRIACYEAYIDVDVKNQPTISTPTVTGNTTTSRPTVAWTYSDSDGDPQSAWDLIVYSSAQYSASGFVAGKAPWVYATINTQRNDAAKFVIPVDLVNSVTYEVFVRAAKVFNGQNWPSTWTPSAPFTMAYEPVPAPSLTVTSDNTVPRVRNKIVVDTKLNVLSSDDASFESGTGTWTNLGNTTLVTSATQVLKGAQSLRLTATAGATDMLVGTDIYSVAPNTAYTFLGSFRAGSTGRSCRLEVRWNDGTGTQIGGNVLGGNVSDTSGGWTQATLTATSPANALTAQLRARVLIPGAGEQHYLDAVSMSTSSSTTWFAGGGSQYDYQMVEYTDLTPQNSLVVNLLQPQLALGGEDFASTAGFFTRSSKDLLTFDRSQSFLGEGSVRWDSGSAAGSAIIDIGTGNGVFDSTYTPPAVPATQYTLSYYALAGSGTHSLRLLATSIDQTGATVGSATTGGTTSVATSWTRLTVTHTAQTGAVGIRISVDNINGDLVPIFLDGGQMEEGAAATLWHEGQGVAPAWQTVRGALTANVAEQRTQLATCFDREAAPGVIRLYRATTIVAYPSGTNGASPASSWVSAKLALLDGGTSTVLKDPNDPTHDIKIRITSITEKISETIDTFNPVRPPAVQAFGQRPVVTSQWISGVGGSITVQITDDHDWFRLLQMLETKSALLLQFPEGGQRYIRITGDRSWPRDPIGVDGRVTRPSRYVRSVSFSFEEVDRPPVLA